MGKPIRLDYQPGIDVESSQTASRGGWNDGNLIRFRGIYPEKNMGWQKICPNPLPGVCRAMHYWADLSNNRWLAAGTNSHLMVVLIGQTEGGGTLFNITPTGLLGGPASSGMNEFSLRIWSLDNFGQDLIAVPSGGAVYLWIPSNPPTLATRIPEAPEFNQGAFVAMPQQIVMAFGSSADGAAGMDPLLLRWCAQSDFNDWTASTVNQAGSFRLSRGNRIVGAIQAPFGMMIWTDIDLWSGQYLGFPLVFGFTQIMSACGLIAQKAATVIGNSIYWMSDHGFFKLDAGGGPQQIPCSVWDFVYKDLDQDNEDKCFAAADALYNEALFFFPSKSGGTGEIDSYVRINTLANPERAWDCGRLVRTAWTDQNRPGAPYGVDQNGLIQQHDTGIDNDGEAMIGVSITSGFMDMSDGGDEMFLSRYEPDFLWTDSTNPDPSIQLTLLFRDWSGEVTTTLGPYRITPTTQYISPRVRAREIAEQITCDELGVWFRRGTPRAWVSPTGKF